MYTARRGRWDEVFLVTYGVVLQRFPAITKRQLLQPLHKFTLLIPIERIRIHPENTLFAQRIRRRRETCQNSRQRRVVWLGHKAGCGEAVEDVTARPEDIADVVVVFGAGVGLGGFTVVQGGAHIGGLGEGGDAGVPGAVFVGIWGC